MENVSSENSVALWYVRYHQPDYDLHDSEREAAEAAVYMEDYGHGVALGVQFEDGRLIVAGEWPEMRAAYERLREAEARQREAWAAAEPRPVRKAVDPFDGRLLEIDADEPAWLGKPAS